MSEFHNQLRTEFADRDYRAAYADSFVDAWIGMQIRVIREQRNLTQKELAEALNTTQTAISRLESANYSGRSISTLKGVAKELDCRLKVSFETYGSLIGEVDKLSAEFLQRPSFNEELAELGKVPQEDIEGKSDRNESAASGLEDMAQGFDADDSTQKREFARRKVSQFRGDRGSSARDLMTGLAPKTA